MFELSKQIKDFFTALPAFTSVCANRISPIFAMADTVYPFATYRINEQNPQSLDGANFTVSVSFWFKPEKYDEVCQLLDAMKPLVDDVYDWQNSTIDFIEENQSFAGIINFNTF